MKGAWLPSRAPGLKTSSPPSVLKPTQLLANPLPPCLKQATPGFSQKRLLWGPTKAEFTIRVPGQTCRAGCKNHTYQDFQSTSFKVLGTAGPAGTTGLLQACGSKCSASALSWPLPPCVPHQGKVQGSGPGEELSQWVVVAQPCCSEGLADTGQEGRKPWVSPRPREAREQVPAPKISERPITATFPSLSPDTCVIMMFWKTSGGAALAIPGMPDSPCLLC